MLQILFVWILMVTAALIMWYLACDREESVKEDKRERAYYIAQILKQQPVQRSTLTPEDLLFLIELNEANHDAWDC